MSRPPRPGDLVVLDGDRCIDLLAQAPYARIAFLDDGEPTVLPINHLLHDGALYFRTAPGSKLGSAAAGQLVAIEADEGDTTHRIAWSVVAKGRASIVTDEAEIEALHSYPFEPWALPDSRSFWIRVDVHTIDGRQISRA